MRSGLNFLAGIFLVSFLSVCQAEDQKYNWSGWNDTASLSLGDTGVYHYTKAFPYPAVDNPLAILKVSDTTAAGLGTDTIAVVWGYQPGKLTQNSSGKRDTLWWYRVPLDTMLTDSLGKTHVPAMSAAGVVTRTLNKMVDTSSVSGYAVQAALYQGEKGWPFVRYWIYALDANKDSPSSIYIFEHNTRLYTPVRAK